MRRGRPTSLRDHERAMTSRFSPHRGQAGIFALRKRLEYGVETMREKRFDRSPMKYAMEARNFAIAVKFILHSPNPEHAETVRLNITKKAAMRFALAYVKVATERANFYRANGWSLGSSYHNSLNYVREVWHEYKASTEVAE